MLSEVKTMRNRSKSVLPSFYEYIETSELNEHIIETRIRLKYTI